MLPGTLVIGGAWVPGLSISPGQRFVSQRNTSFAASIALSYGVFAALWIFGSDQALLLFVNDPAAIVRWSSIKGLAFVCVTTLGLYLLVHHRLGGQMAYQARLEQKANHDALTGLPNRTLLADRLEVAMQHAQRAGSMLAVCFLDLDGFKAVNDSFGHAVGDELLVALAERFRCEIRGVDTVARLGGDEFVLLLGDLDTIQECQKGLGRILSTVAEPYVLNKHVCRVSASIGVTIFPNDANNAEALLRNADKAMYSAKEAGKNRYMLFDGSHARRAQAGKAMIDRIDKALDAGQVGIHYQPVVDFAAGRVQEVEGLARWEHPVLGVLRPSEFRPLIENDPVAEKLGLQVLRGALEQMRRWRGQGISLPVSVNLGRRQLTSEGLSRTLAGLREAFSDLDFGDLAFEVPERWLIDDSEVVGSALEACRAAGVRLIIDDCGSVYGALNPLSRLRPDRIKTSACLTRAALDGDPAAQAQLAGLNSMARALGIPLVLKGVEEAAGLAQVPALGCARVQGYGIAPPMRAAELPGWLAGYEKSAATRASVSVPEPGD